MRENDKPFREFFGQKAANIAQRLIESDSICLDCADKGGVDLNKVKTERLNNNKRESDGE